MYEKYLKFKENIDVNLNPLLKWCPKADCNRYVSKGKKRKVVCDCGTEVCFTCGAQWHGRLKCNEAMDKEFFAWASKSGNVSNCPKCKVRVQKTEGCNHMTCRQCNYQWCWVCGGKYTSNHYEAFNIFGCPGMQFYSNNQCKVFLLNFVILLGLPFIIFFTPVIIIVAYYFSDGISKLVENVLCCGKEPRGCCGIVTYIITFIITFPVYLGVACAAGALTLAVMILPGYLFQLYRIFKIVFRRFKCCLK